MESGLREAFLADISEISAIGAVEGRGRTRLALSDTDAKARKWFVAKLKELGLEIKVDMLGNITGILSGAEGMENPVTIGSHLDTVIEGGALDGAYGIVAGLAVIRAIRENGLKLRRPIAVVDFTNEEGVRFNPGMTGSSFAAGKPADERLKKLDSNGLSVGEELKRIGFAGTDAPVKPSEYLELHIEQGPRLQDAEKRIGVVTGIAGVASWRVHFIGQPSHAGAFPMNIRRDPLAGMADFSQKLREFVATIPGAVGTIGWVSIFPGAINVVPGKMSFTVDARTTGEENFKRLKTGVERELQAVADKHNLKIELERMANVAPIIFPDEMTSLIEKCAKDVSPDIMQLPSGAFHDAQFMHSVCPTGMIFVPSIAGLSHCPQEKTDEDDLWLGVNVLQKVAETLAK